MGTSQDSSAQGAEPTNSTLTDTTAQLGTGSETTISSTARPVIQSSNSDMETDVQAIPTSGPSNDDTTTPGTPATSPTTTPQLASTTSTTTEEPASASNLVRIGPYFYIGCLGSEDGYPAFTEVATDDDMTPKLCIELAGDSRYVGLFNRYVKKHEATVVVF